VKRRERKLAIAVLSAAALVALVSAPGAAHAQHVSTLSTSPSGTVSSETMRNVPMLKLYEDSKGQVFTTPARGRRFLAEIPATALVPQEIEQRVEQKTQAQLLENKAEISKVAQQNAELAKQNQDLTKQVAEMKPAWQDFDQKWYKKVSFGTLVYGDYRFMPHTGFGPQFLTQMQWPGPGNNGYNAFDITRAYLDFKFTPNKDFLLRVTPNIYASTNGSTDSKTVGQSSAWGNTTDGNLNYRLKYAYVDYNTFFQKVIHCDAMKDDKFTFGQEQNPLVDWEENLYGFRYVNLTPWNYLSLSSTQIGFSMKGPIKFHEMQYIDYDIGVYNNASFHAYEQSNTKQIMGRVTFNPLGAKSRYDSLGLTAFVDYGWGNNPPDVSSAGGGTQNWRTAFLVHYTAKSWAIAGEYDIGKNALSSGQLFSGSGPCTSTSGGCTGGFAGWNTMVKDILNNQATQQGFDFFGHVDIPQSKFTVFGFFQEFLPNTKVDKNPLDFQRWIVGVQYKVNKHFRVAADSQNISYYHDQFTLPATTLGSIDVPMTPYSVARDSHAFMLNMQFSY
jgi:hypothetical protein